MLTLLTYAALLHAAAGTPDPAFGPNGNGISIIDVGRTNNLVGIAGFSDDSFAGVGNVIVTTTTTGACSFTSTGTFSTSFGTGGYTRLVTGYDATVMQTIAIQADNKIVTGGYAIDNRVSKFALARFDNITGLLDTSFAGVGYVATNIRNGSSANALCLQSDGKILLAGAAGSGQPGCTIARYNTDGTLDTNFGTDGYTTVNPGYVSAINSLAVQADGKIVAAGFAWNFATDISVVIRFNTDGAVDTTFGTNGVVTMQIGGASRATAIAVQTDGSIVVGGYTTDNNIHYAFYLMRYDASGTLDTTFDAGGTAATPGIIITPMDYSARLNALVIQADGKIVAGGSNFGLRSTTFTIARYLTTGALDSGFGTNGITFTTIGETAQINSLILQSDGNIVAAGTSDTSAALVRYFA